MTYLVLHISIHILQMYPILPIFCCCTVRNLEHAWIVCVVWDVTACFCTWGGLISDDHMNDFYVTSLHNS
jgi:hypothetical protein